MTRFWSVSVAVVVMAMTGVAQKKQQPLPVELLGVANESGYRGIMFRDEVTQALLAALNATGIFAAKDARLEVKLPLDASALLEVGKALKASFVMQGVIKEVNLVRLKNRNLRTSVVLEAVLASVKAPHLFYKAKAKGQGEDAAEGRAVAKAVEASVIEIARQLSAIVPLKGQVLLPPIERVARISLDMNSQICVGSEVVILKKGVPVASGTVTEVDIGSSLVALMQVIPNTHLHSGDEVKVTFLPQHPAKLPLPLEKEREYKRVEHDFALALLIAGVAVAFIGE